MDILSTIFQQRSRRIGLMIPDVVVLWSNLNGHFDRVFSPRQGT